MSISIRQHVIHPEVTLAAVSERAVVRAVAAIGRQRHQHERYNRAGPGSHA